jgi:hypothetical protein
MKKKQNLILFFLQNINNNNNYYYYCNYPLLEINNLAFTTEKIGI